MRFFTETEITQLKSEKEQLLQPITYFFRQIKSISEFKEVCGPMFFLQWEFFNSGVQLARETFSALKEAVSSLKTFNFLLTREKSCEAGKKALMAVGKFALALSFLLFHTLRLFTLLVATFFPHILVLGLTVIITYFSLPLLGMELIGQFTGGLILSACAGVILLCLASLVKCDNHQAKTEKVTEGVNEEDLKEYDILSEQVFNERTQIVEALDNACKDDLSPTNKDYQFFSTNSSSSTGNHRSRTESKELWDGLNNLIESYPKFKATRARAEPEYIKNLTRDLVEHHAKTKEVAETCLVLMWEALNTLKGASIYSEQYAYLRSN